MSSADATKTLMAMRRCAAALSRRSLPGTSSPSCSSPVTTASTASIDRRRRPRELAQPVDDLTADGAERVLERGHVRRRVVELDGRPIENWRRPIETRASAGPGAVTRSEMMMAVMREPIARDSSAPAARDVVNQRRRWRDAPVGGYQVKPEPMRYAAHPVRMLARLDDRNETCGGYWTVPHSCTSRAAVEG